MDPFSAIAPSTFSTRIDLDRRFVIDNLLADGKNHASFVSPYLRANLSQLDSYSAARNRSPVSSRFDMTYRHVFNCYYALNLNNEFIECTKNVN